MLYNQWQLHYGGCEQLVLAYKTFLSNAVMMYSKDTRGHSVALGTWIGAQAFPLRFWDLILGTLGSMMPLFCKLLNLSLASMGVAFSFRKLPSISEDSSTCTQTAIYEIFGNHPSICYFN